jgi:hypothetical protein
MVKHLKLTIQRFIIKIIIIIIIIINNNIKINIL